ncbi:hypothetical protein AXE65_01285 [Ventosimonas gracilis]|uniref:Alpha-2-macroglobulin n=1 Tax=Ventosimonas gracilis TaxID=1680762 RepID=A0A139SUW8_9GAMM|nr:alpha-2-macroglobulin [Ventosimonas gracilis]KXU38377.1 hypothetical protein AXE65_01285 [Ventosimonas gracilis]
MPYLRLLLVCALFALTACEQSSTDSSQNQLTTAAQAQTGQPQPPKKASLDTKELAQRYADRPLTVADVSEIQLDGASTLSVTFSTPLDPQQKLSDRLHLVDSKSGAVDGAWELSDNLMTVYLRHLEPQRELIFTADAHLQGVAGQRLGTDHSEKLATQDIKPMIGFASRGSLLPTRLAEGLPVIALNVDKVNVEFFRIKPESLPKFLSQWGRSTGLVHWNAEDLIPMADLVYGGRFDLNPARNTRERLLLPLSGIKALQEPGVYFAVMREAGDYSRYTHPATVFSLSDIGLSAHRYQGQLAVFTQALEGGEALAGIELELLDDKGQLVQSGKTDKAGYALLPLSTKAEVLLARQGHQTSVLQLKRAALDLSEFKVDGASAQALQFFVFGPRDLYRPGETVLLNALLRDADGKPVAAQPVTVEVKKPDGQTARTFVWNPGEGGFYQYQLPIDAGAPTGRWQLLFNLTGNSSAVHSYELMVEDFLPERMALTLSASKEPLSPKELAQIEVEGRYLYGAPAAGNRLSGQFFVRPLREAVPALPGYQFGSVTEKIEQYFDLDEENLDSEGKAQLIIESLWAETRSPLALTVQASLQESGGRPITRRVQQPIWPAKQMPGLRPLFDGLEVDADSLAEFELVMADIDGNKLAADNLALRFIHERRDYYWSFSEDSGWGYRYNEKPIQLDQSTVQITEGSSLNLSFPVEWGSYRVEVEDPKSGVISSVRFWAGYRSQDNSEDGAVRPDQVKLSLDKPAYQAGEIAQVTITPPAAGRGWLLLESSKGPLWWQEIDLPEGGKTVELPVSHDWARHDLYLSALVIRPSERKVASVPKRAVGVLHLPLSRQERKLSLNLQAPEKMRPRQPLKVKVSGLDAQGVAASGAKVLVSAVDVGILNITDYKTPDPFAALFSRKGYGVDQMDVYSQLIEAGNARLANLAFGGDAELESGGKRPDTSVNIVALQSAPVTLDENGQAEISLDIPDFNGELRLMAQIWNDQQFGASEEKTIVAAPLIVELSAPRFLGSGDHSLLALDLHNLTDTAQQLEIQVEFDGQLTSDTTPSWSQSLAAGGKHIAHLPVSAKSGYGTGTVRVSVTGLSLPDETFDVWQRQWRIGVRPPYPAQVKILRAALEGGKSWSKDELLAGFARAGLQARFELSAHPPLNLSEHIRALEAYPYGCAEQTTSGLFPSLYADAASLKKLGLQGDSNSERAQKIEIGIERLLGMQRYSGGFGLWSNNGREEYWLTPYIFDFLLRAREQGFTVPQQALDKTSERLLRYLQERSLIEPDYTEDSAHSIFATQAYAGFVLSRSQQAPLGTLRNLFERRGEAQSGLPLLHLSIALKNMGDELKAQQALSEALSKQRSSQYWLGDYGSDLRDQALILALLDEHQLLPQAQREERLFALSDLLGRQSYLSTQERGALFMVGRRLLNWASGDWTAKLQSGEQSFALSNHAASLAFSAESLADSLRVENNSEQTLYQRLDISGYPISAPPAGGENLKIDREYLSSDGQPLSADQLSQLKSGDLLLVHIRLSAKNRVPDALVVDLLPAGLELENQNLASSSAQLTATSHQVKEWQREMYYRARIKHQEYRDDRYVAALDIDSGVVTHLLYLARAVTPGTYQIPPPQVESMYRPNWQAIGSTSGTLTIQAER